MSAHHRITVQQQILHAHKEAGWIKRDSVLTCPACSEQHNLTLCGQLGDPATVECPRGHKFPCPPPFDAVALLHQVVAQRDDQIISQTPRPRH